MSASLSPELDIRLFGGPTVLLDYGGLRLLTDPTFDDPQRYEVGPGEFLVKTAASAIAPSALGAVDAVLLSHDEHPDNLDHSGRALLASAAVVLTTVSGAGRLGGNAVGMAPWQTRELPRPGGGSVTVTAVPALHGPEGCEPFTGEVVGFVLSGTGLPTVYISGDNASLDVVREIAGRFDSIDTAVLFAGAVRTPLFDGALLTLDGAAAAEAARILDADRVIPAHVDSWGHFTEGREEFVSAFAAAGLSGRLAG